MSAINFWVDIPVIGERLSILQNKTFQKMESKVPRSLNSNNSAEISKNREKPSNNHIYLL